MGRFPLGAKPALLHAEGTARAAGYTSRQRPLCSAPGKFSVDEFCGAVHWEL